MPVTPPTAADMRLDGGHPALDFVNTVYAPPTGPIDHDVLRAPADLVTFARRVGLATRSTPSSPAALAAARELRTALHAALRGGGTHRELERFGRDALAAGRLAREGDALRWTWRAGDAMTPVHRLAHAGLALLGDAAELARLHRCDNCSWLFLDHSRGAGRRWCSMADCGSAVKQERYVARRRQRRAAAGLR